MVIKVKNALLLSDVSSFYSHYKILADEISVNLKCEAEWNSKYRIKEEVVIAGSKYLKSINETYYPVTVVILKDYENPAPYIKMGITRFIFNHRNTYELLCALYKTEAIIVQAKDENMENILKNSDVWNYCMGDYDFKFDVNKFSYKGKLIYLSKASKKYLAEWLLNGNKDNSKRMILCNLRKKFGKDFLADVNRTGGIKDV